MAWKSIKTAPKDGSSILLFCPDFKEILIAHYQDTSMDGKRGKFIWQLPNDGGTLAESVPSHWCPLPTPPRRPVGGQARD